MKFKGAKKTSTVESVFKQICNCKDRFKFKLSEKRTVLRETSTWVHGNAESYLSSLQTYMMEVWLRHKYACHEQICKGFNCCIGKTIFIEVSLNCSVNFKEFARNSRSTAKISEVVFFYSFSNVIPLIVFC